MTLELTGLYACALALWAGWLGASVSIMRAKTGISILHGEDMALAEKIRKHGNFTEVVPLALILMAIVELNGASTTWLHAIGGLLLVSRLVHPFGIKHDNPQEILRGIGSGGTSLSMVLSIIFIVWTFAAA